MKQNPRLRRTFLFLQGPHGTFFPKLGGALHEAGHRIRRVNLNGGDRATWPAGADFRGGDRLWPDYVRVYMSREGVTDLVLFGDSRPPHVAAIRIARALGIRVHVFEEGYIRPDWVTLERDGVNGHSTLPRDLDYYRRQARGLPRMPAHPPIPSYATARGWAAFFYYAEVVLQHWRFPFHGSHRERNPVWEGINFLRRFRRRDREQHASDEALARIAGRRFFLFPLQLDSDYQIRVHSPFGAMRPAIERVLESFARHADDRTALVVKEHPLDGGLQNWREVVESIAAGLGVADRVAFVEQGDLLELVRGSSGMVAVNSTSGTLALAAGRPVKVLGDAVYDIAGITHQGGLDGFWAMPQAPDRSGWDAFCRVLARRCLIHGAFLSNAGIDMLVQVATARLTATDDVNLRPASASASVSAPASARV